MTDLKLEILKKAYNNEQRNLNSTDFLRASVGKLNQAKYALDELIYCKLLEKPLGSEFLHLTDKGAVEYELELEARQRRAEEEERFTKTYKFNRNTTIFSLIVAAVAALIALVEAFTSH